MCQAEPARNNEHVRAGWPATLDELSLTRRLTLNLASTIASEDVASCTEAHGRESRETVGIP
jgi:hypothetical protein